MFWFSDSTSDDDYQYSANEKSENDSYSSVSDVENIDESESDKDFCPSPKKKKTKETVKANKKTLTSKTSSFSKDKNLKKSKICNKKSEVYNKENKARILSKNNACDSSVSQPIVSLVPVENCATKDALDKTKPEKNETSEKRLFTNSKPNTTYDKNEKNVSRSPVINKSSAIPNLSKASGLVRTAFKSPTINGVKQPWSSSKCDSSTPPSNSGLRLGLSRRGNFKPLHANISLK